MPSQNNFRNVAIIAHVDHGKTTLVDAILHQSGTFRENQQVQERAMDSNDLERERGITILAKCTAIDWEGNRIHVIDTPGHADFGGEVERVLNMADGVILLVDAAEGALPQTKFVLGKSLKLGMRPIVVINKVDRPDARPEEVVDEIFDLFVSLDATDEQCDFPIMYASGREGWVAPSVDGPKESVKPLLELIVRHVPPPKGDSEAPFQMVATLLDKDPFLGRILVGRIVAGKAKVNSQIRALNLKGELVEQFRLTKLMKFKGLEKEITEEAGVGEIVCLAGMTKATVADTLADPSVNTPLPSQPIDPPTISITVGVNDSPFSGLEGSKLTSTQLRDRLFAEAESNVAIKVSEAEGKDAFEVAGRGELQLGVLIENMRREGFELSISRPKVLFKKDEHGKRTEPYEEVIIDVDEEFSNTVVNMLLQKKGEMREMKTSSGGKTRLVFVVPSRSLIGFHSRFLTETRGTGVLNRLFHGYGPYCGDMAGRHNGAMISTEKGQANAYALFNLQERGILFTQPGEQVYGGMIVGEHSRDNDLEVNPIKGKQLTNVRSSGKDESLTLTPPKLMSLEEMISYINEDELVEVTPKSLRLRKKFLTPQDRARAKRSNKTG
jgi:GTP-binding protein